MKHITGNTPEEKFSSIDGIIGSLKKKAGLIHGKLQKKEKPSMPFNMSGYAEQCTSGEIVCGYFSLIEIDAKGVVVVIDDYPKDIDLFVVITIRPDRGAEKSSKAKIIKGTNAIDFNEKIKKGDRISMSIEYPDSSPRGVWVAMRGDQS